MIKSNELVHPDCPNFKWYEVWKSDTATRKEINNVSTSAEVHGNARAFVINIMQPLRTKFGKMKASSWFRCEELEKDICDKGYRRWCFNSNRVINANSWSLYFSRKSHPDGGTADIEIIGLPNDDLFNYIKDNMEFDQLIREYAVDGDPMSGWVHVSWAGSGNRNEVLHRP